MPKRLPKEEYENLKKFKKMVREERANKLIKDHSGHIYKVTKDGSLERLTRDELELLELSSKRV